MPEIILHPASDAACADGDRTYIAQAYYLDSTRQLQAHALDVTPIYHANGHFDINQLEHVVVEEVNAAAEQSQARVDVKAIAALAILRACYEHGDEPHMEYSRAYILIDAHYRELWRKQGSEDLQYDDNGLGTFKEGSTTYPLVVLPFAEPSPRTFIATSAATKPTVFVARQNSAALVTRDYLA